MNKRIAMLFSSALSICLNAQATLGPAVTTFGVLAGCGPTVEVGNLGSRAETPVGRTRAMTTFSPLFD